MTVHALSNAFLVREAEALLVRLGQGNPLMLEAEVVRSGTADGGRQRGIAVRFKDLSELDELLLNELIDRTRT